jgi:hypothetical protein
MSRIVSYNFYFFLHKIIVIDQKMYFFHWKNEGSPFVGASMLFCVCMMFYWLASLWFSCVCNVLDLRHCALWFICACTLLIGLIVHRNTRTCLAVILGITSDRLYIMLSHRGLQCAIHAHNLSSLAVSCPVGQHTKSSFYLAGTARKCKGYTPCI